MNSLQFLLATLLLLTLSHLNSILTAPMHIESSAHVNSKPILDTDSSAFEEINVCIEICAECFTEEMESSDVCVYFCLN